MFILLVIPSNLITLPYMSNILLHIFCFTVKHAPLG